MSWAQHQREMEHDDDAGRRYRKRAKGLRDDAAAAPHEITRETLVKLSEEYDRMAAYQVIIYPKKLPWFIC